ncbi:type I-E CRISPR-associated endoribonuclease Cas2 [Ideonella dechloratans]|uniref:Type I-E CRISPR-associated endoribonuclease Cas2 n=2 Tax=Ideonella dechloratans TaxID=36863 RepID=A0A643FE46_IDEDE|nr:type I-E CRISPR-associated endoribonuclease Cas2 [Ideonella dechloratans]UFU10595.1 type I-E CRISPR-associated endoribonuclease Cas2e [Ideonella dechloratans]
MALTMLITRDVEDRYRGFLSSAMLELAPGVYASPHLSTRAREQIWSVVSDWHAQLGNGSITLVYPDRKADGGLIVQSVGTPTREIVRLDGTLLTKRVNP